MNPSSGLRATLLISLVYAGVTLGAACGGSNKPATTGPDRTGDVGTEPALGTTGVPGLDWGASADAVRAAFPQSTPTDGGLWSMGTTDGHQSLTTFKIGAAGLEQVDIEWVEGYVSMDDCGKGWAEVRTKVDGRLGPSTQDNLAAYWNTASASVTLSCSPNDSGAGVLSQNFSPRQAE